MSKASLMRKLVKLEYKDGGSMVVHLNDFQGLINQLSAMSMSPEYELQGLLLLSSLPESWDTLVASLSNSPQGKWFMDMVKVALLNEEARRKYLIGSNHSEANVVFYSNKGRVKNKDSSHNRDKSRGKSKLKSEGEIICHYCNNPGHIEKFCRKKKRDKP